MGFGLDQASCKLTRLIKVTVSWRKKRSVTLRRIGRPAHPRPRRPAFGRAHLVGGHALERRLDLARHGDRHGMVPQPPKGGAVFLQHPAAQVVGGLPAHPHGSRGLGDRAGFRQGSKELGDLRAGPAILCVGAEITAGVGRVWFCHATRLTKPVFVGKWFSKRMLERTVRHPGLPLLVLGRKIYWPPWSKAARPRIKSGATEAWQLRCIARSEAALPDTTRLRT